MLRLLAACTLVHVVTSQSSSAFDEVFSESGKNNDIEAVKCTGIEGTAPLCMACYTCDDEKVKNRSILYRLGLKDGKCQRTEVCCISAQHLVPREFKKCGTTNPEGFPRRRRPTLRSVLEREYPWRAWVYSTEDLQTPLCAASYIDSSAKALLTTASCVSGRPPSMLAVKFIKQQTTPNRLAHVDVHTAFDKGTGKNDLAMLTLTSSPGERVQPVCWSHVPPRYGTACVAVSDSETYVNMLIPQQKNCKTAMKDMDESLMCAASPAGDYKPPEGAGVYCLQDEEKVPTYVLVGISLNLHEEKVLSFHTNVTHFAKWIEQTINLRKP